MRSFYKTLPIFALAVTLTLTLGRQEVNASSKGAAQQSKPTPVAVIQVPPNPDSVVPAMNSAVSRLMLVVGSMGRLNFRLKTDMNFESGPASGDTSEPPSKSSLDIENLKGVFEVPFTNDIVFPFAKDTTKAENAKFVPSLTLATKGLILHMTTVNAGTGNDQSIQSKILFFKNGKAVPLTVTVSAPEIDFISFQIRSVDFDTKGLIGTDQKNIVVTGSCGLKQSLIDDKTSSMVFKETECSYNGNYDRTNKKYKVHLHYDSMD